MNTNVNPSVPAADTVHQHWQGILECAAQEVFQMMAGANLTLRPASGDPPKVEQTAIVGMAGVLCGMTSVQCSTQTAAKLASFMLNSDPAGNPGMIADALGELCNMIAGNFKAKITTLEDRCMLSAPTVISGGDYLLRILEPSECLRAAFDYEDGVIWVVLTIHA